eukprot:scaffold289055_cov41-Tisochrysis_lutea.AAC.4
MSVCPFTIILILELSVARDLHVSLTFHKTHHETLPNRASRILVTMGWRVHPIRRRVLSHPRSILYGYKD